MLFDFSPLFNSFSEASHSSCSEPPFYKEKNDLFDKLVNRKPLKKNLFTAQDLIAILQGNTEIVEKALSGQRTEADVAPAAPPVPPTPPAPPAPPSSSGGKMIILYLNEGLAKALLGVLSHVILEGDTASALGSLADKIAKELNLTTEDFDAIYESTCIAPVENPQFGIYIH